MNWDEVCRIKAALDDMAPWRLMQAQQRSAGRWVVCLFNPQTKERAEIHRDGWGDFLTKYGLRMPATLR